MEIKRVGYDSNYQMFCDEQSFNRNLSFVALNENKEIVSVCDFNIINHKEASLNEIKNFKQDIEKIVDQFTEEFLYWNPFIRYIYYIGNKIENKKACNIFKIAILDVKIEQLTVSESKLNKALEWISKEEEVIICAVKIDNQIVCIDGYSRLLAAYLNGFKYVYYYLDEDYDETDYREFLRWCQNENIISIKDLQSRVVSDEMHQKLWIDKCQTYFKNKR